MKTDSADVVSVAVAEWVSRADRKVGRGGECPATQAGTEKNWGTERIQRGMNYCKYRYIEIRVKRRSTAA